MVSDVSPQTKGEVSYPDEIDETVVKEFATWEDVQTYFASEGIEVSTGMEISDGFVLLEEGEKIRFVGQPLMILDWRFYAGDFGDAVTFRFMDAHGGKWRGNDGSTGIKEQLSDITEARKASGHKAPQQALAVRKGFQASDYYIDSRDNHAIERGEEVPDQFKQKATTFYLRF